MNTIATQHFRFKPNRETVFRCDYKINVRMPYKRTRAPIRIEQSTTSKLSRSLTNRLISIFSGSEGGGNGWYWNSTYQTLDPILQNLIRTIARSQLWGYNHLRRIFPYCGKPTKVLTLKVSEEKLRACLPSAVSDYPRQAFGSASTLIQQKLKNP